MYVQCVVIIVAQLKITPIAKFSCAIHKWTSLMYLIYYYSSLESVCYYLYFSIFLWIDCLKQLCLKIIMIIIIKLLKKYIKKFILKKKKYHKKIRFQNGKSRLTLDSRIPLCLNLPQNKNKNKKRNWCDGNKDWEH